MKLIEVLEADNGIHVKIFYLQETGEYQVCYFDEMLHKKKLNYLTDDPEDTQITANRMLEEVNK